MGVQALHRPRLSVCSPPGEIRVQAGADPGRHQVEILGNLSAVLAEGASGDQDRDDRKLYRVRPLRGWDVSGGGRWPGGVLGQNLREEKDQAEFLFGRKFRMYH